VIAALARYNPFSVCLIAFLLGGLQNAGYASRASTFRRASSVCCRG